MERSATDGNGGTQSANCLIRCNADGAGPRKHSGRPEKIVHHAKFAIGSDELLNSLAHLRARDGVEKTGHGCEHYTRDMVVLDSGANVAGDVRRKPQLRAPCSRQEW